MTELDPVVVLRAYEMGVFPMADHRDAASVYWVEPKWRGVLPLDGMILSRSLRKRIGQDRFRVTADRDFAGIIQLCAQSAPDRPDTWINSAIERCFLRLHALGHAHSVEVWDADDRLVGGLYGLALGRAFFGESMVSRATDASKVALAWLVARLRTGGFTLLDCQFQTDHLATLGAVEIPRVRYSSLLGAALGGLDPAAGAGGGAADGSAPSAAASPASPSGDFGALDRLAPPSGVAGASAPGKVILQLLGHTS
ncbi:leucyl/phenylalanyl-tRNA--protein transferase [Sphingomonas sp. BGYR3]|uniref:leucyl/phenylalanyl-tRNA--protein transferase n=1 Tax=Sphingomonas sp. BGYR3 TaxID=2975483 RepID=UPI0021A51904|nr:leucyl/phenylalanyl-tRNA--protein transferase [Sphingomonas sp. BGYR3]MDG5489538.1 leucyl/phenylalanyl-tRNA--protein transferase [Sphingomonas sp. BGYR3]